MKDYSYWWERRDSLKEISSFLIKKEKESGKEWSSELCRSVEEFIGERLKSCTLTSLLDECAEEAYRKGEYGGVWARRELNRKNEIDLEKEYFGPNLP